MATTAERVRKAEADRLRRRRLEAERRQREGTITTQTSTEFGTTGQFDLQQIRAEEQAARQTGQAQPERAAGDTDADRQAQLGRTQQRLSDRDLREQRTAQQQARQGQQQQTSTSQFEQLSGALTSLQTRGGTTEFRTGDIQQQQAFEQFRTGATADLSAGSTTAEREAAGRTGIQQILTETQDKDITALFTAQTFTAEGLEAAQKAAKASGDQRLIDAVDVVASGTQSFLEEEEKTRQTDIETAQKNLQDFQDEQTISSAAAAQLAEATAEAINPVEPVGTPTQDFLAQSEEIANISASTAIDTIQAQEALVDAGISSVADLAAQARAQAQRNADILQLDLNAVKKQQERNAQRALDEIESQRRGAEKEQETRSRLALIRTGTLAAQVGSIWNSSAFQAGAQARRDGNEAINEIRKTSLKATQSVNDRLNDALDNYSSNTRKVAFNLDTSLQRITADATNQINSLIVEGLDKKQEGLERLIKIKQDLLDNRFRFEQEASKQDRFNTTELNKQFAAQQKRFDKQNEADLGVSRSLPGGFLRNSTGDLLLDAENRPITVQREVDRTFVGADGFLHMLDAFGNEVGRSNQKVLAAVGKGGSKGLGKGEAIVRSPSGVRVGNLLVAAGLTQPEIKAGVDTLEFGSALEKNAFLDNARQNENISTPQLNELTALFKSDLISTSAESRGDPFTVIDPTNGQELVRFADIDLGPGRFGRPDAKEARNVRVLNLISNQALLPVLREDLEGTNISDDQLIQALAGIESEGIDIDTVRDIQNLAKGQVPLAKRTSLLAQNYRDNFSLHTTNGTVDQNTIRNFLGQSGVKDIEQVQEMVDFLNIIQTRVFEKLDTDEYAVTVEADGTIRVTELDILLNPDDLVVEIPPFIQR